MAAPPPLMSDLARRVLASSQTPSDPHDHEVVIAIKKLRLSLTRFAGADGFASLLRRALTLARAGMPSLQGVKIGPDGHLVGFDQIATDSPKAGIEEAVAITAQLLGLLTCFIGAPLTLRLLREAWPGIALDELYSTIETDR